MAKMIIGGVKYQMSIAMKARLLAQTIQTTDDANVLTVESGTDRNKRHFVTHDQHVALSCSCPAVGNCAHRIAVEKYLREQPGEMEAEAMDIIAEEQSRKQQAQRKPLPRINTSKYAVYNANYRPHNDACTCGATDWQEHYKMEFEAYVAAEAVKEAERHLAEERRNKIESFSFYR